MHDLNAAEKELLQSLAHDERWRSIMAKIKRSPAGIRYRPGGEEGEDAKVQKWRYESGRCDESEAILRMLTLGAEH